MGASHWSDFRGRERLPSLHFEKLTIFMVVLENSANTSVFGALWARKQVKLVTTHQAETLNEEINDNDVIRFNYRRLRIAA